jgi:chemotaxis family two-component system sensor kinase Cph1
MTTYIDSKPPRTQKAAAGGGSTRELRLLNAALTRQAERDAADLSAARAELDYLAQWISHDLRSPLHVITGFSDLLVKKYSEKLDETGAHYLQVVADSTERIGQVLDEILALSRVSQSEMHLVHIELNDLVARVVRELEATKGERRIVWEIGRLPAVQADPTLLRQAIAGMLSNAVASTLSCKVARIEVGARAAEGEVTFFVRDNSEGLDLGHRERMFGVVRGSAPAARGGVGTIGLAYLKRLIQRHGGRAWAEASPGGGATFLFSLPGGRAGRTPRGESG